MASSRSQYSKSEQNLPSEKPLSAFQPRSFMDVSQVSKHRNNSCIGNHNFARISLNATAIQRDDVDGDGVEDEPRADTWERQPDGRLTDEAIVQLRTQVVDATRLGRPGDRGVMPDEGSFENVRRWSDARINRALRLLADLDHGTDTTSSGRQRRGRRGGMDRPVLAWRSHLDDLGLPDRRTAAARAAEYQNILEFVDRLDRLSISTLGTEYNPEFGQGGMDSMPTIRLAGASVGVHPRALWFTAAAQAGMDRRAGRDAGGGHYVPAGGFRVMLRDIAEMARRLGTERTPRRERQRRGPRRRDRSTPLPNSGAIYGVLHSELTLALQVLEAQDNGTDMVEGYHHDEHREPVLREFLLSHAEEIRALPATASNDDAADSARQIAAILEGLPGGSSRRHGFGSIDPHGTEHAMGLAIDIYNGAGPGGSLTNFAPPRDYWPFIHRLIERYGSEVGVPSTIRPDSWSDLDRTGDQATVARGIATLIQTHGSSEVADIEASAAPSRAVAREDARLASRFAGLRNRARRALRNRLQALGRAARSPFLDWTMDNDVERERDAIVTDIERIEGTSHSDLILLLQRHHLALSALEAHEDADGDVGPPPPMPRRRRPPDPLAQVGPDDASGTRLDLSNLILSLEEMGTDVDAAVARHETTDLAELVRSRGFRRWLTRVSDRDRPVYDQPTLMVESFNDVVGTHFYGGHHWEIAPLPESEGGHSILDQIDDYRHALDADLQGIAEGPRARPPRDSGEVERILNIMAESSGGRNSIFGTAQLAPVLPAETEFPMCGPDTSLPTLEPQPPPEETDSTAGGSDFEDVDMTGMPTTSNVPPGSDATLHAALVAHLGDITPMLQRVHARAVAPYEGVSGESGRIMRDLRDRGFYITPAAAP